MSSTRAKVVLITGCSQGGIGYHLAEEFALRGCIVYATARNVAKMSSLQHPNIRFKALDVTIDESVEATVKDIIQEVGRVDILVNNAGAMCIGPAIEVDMKRALEVFDINFFGILRMARSIIPYMAARKSGLVINVGSIVGDTPTPWNGLYCCSKSAVASLTDILSMECTPLKVKVMLLNVSSVKSNISTNQAPHVRLLENSLYANYVEKIIRRLHLSQNSNPMPTAEFAKIAVDRALKQSPPARLTLGGALMLYNIVRLLPRDWRLWFTWKWSTQ